MDELARKETMSSLQIAEVTGKLHKHVMESIRNMEVAWEQVNGTKFRLVEYTDKKGEKRPMYELNKTECLYIATKFNDEARARLVLRWEELEMQSRQPKELSRKELALMVVQAEEEKERLQLENKVQAQQIEVMSSEIVELKKKTEYVERILSCKGTVTVTQIAQDYGMSAKAFNRLLAEMGVQRKVNGQWILYAQYLAKGYVQSKSVDIVRRDGSPDVRMNTEWTQRGRLFLYEQLKADNVLPLIERAA